jgi:hypothetical protein
LPYINYFVFFSFFIFIGACESPPTATDPRSALTVFVFFTIFMAMVRVTAMTSVMDTTIQNVGSLKREKSKFIAVPFGRKSYPEYISAKHWPLQKLSVLPLTENGPSKGCSAD